jgi:hypothetical protein
MRPRSRLALALFAVATLVAAAGCRTTPFSELERVESLSMRFDTGSLRAELQSHVLSTREGAIGGFGPVGAGGCGCH